MVACHNIDSSKRVYVYWNLHEKCFSVRQSNKVVRHLNSLCLKDVKYLVQPAGRAKVLRDKVKNVHAGLSGYYVESVPVPTISFDVTYNPYKYDSFVDVEDREPMEWSEYAYLERQHQKPTIEAIFTRNYFEKLKETSCK
jgi:hypothetical protein